MRQTWPLLLLLCSCASSPGEPKGTGGTGVDPCAKVHCDGDQVCQSGKCACPTGKSFDDFAVACMPTLPAAVCHPTSQWTGTEQAFTEPAGDWGLTAFDKATDVHVTEGDIDHDGWPDIVIDGSTIWLAHNKHGSFEYVTESSGFSAPRHATTARPAGAVVFADVDNDGDLDAFQSYNGTSDTQETSEIMLNDGQGHFTLGPTGQPFQVHTIPFASAAFVDYDRDGYIDLWAGVLGDNFSPFQNHLLRGGAGGMFTDVTDDSGLKTHPPSTANVDPWNQGLDHSLTWAVGACDLNGDGTPELIDSSYGRQPNHLWLGKRDAGGKVSYINRSVVSGYAYDARMNWQEDESARCYCKLHPDTAYCDGVPTDAIRIVCRAGHDEDWQRWDPTYGREPFELGGNSAASVCSDFNGDGWMDILTGTIVHWDVGSGSDPSEILYNKQDNFVSFDRPGNDVTGMVRPHKLEDWNDGDMTNAVLDFDNDGRPDILIGSAGYPGTRAWLFHQKPDGKFEMVPLNLAIDQRSDYGVTVGDFDRDGGLDIVTAHSEIRCDPAGPTDQCYAIGQRHPRIFLNALGQNGNWMQLDLEGIAGTNRSAIGARVTVEADGLVQTQEVEGGHGHYGMQNDHVLHFGLGAACQAKVTVRWPNAALTTERFTVGSGHRYHVVQGAGPVAEDPESATPPAPGGRIVRKIAAALVLVVLAGCPKEGEPAKPVPPPPPPLAAAPATPPSAAPVAPAAPAEPTKPPSPKLMNPSALNEKAPATFKAEFVTTQGPFTIEVHRDWSPNGADRFYNLVKNGFYDDTAVFRALPDFMDQFGIAGDPAVAAHWKEATIPDDPVKQSNKRGFVTFAKSSAPNSRTTQVFVNKKDNAFLDGMGFSPFGQVTSGMEVVDKLYTGYGEGAPRGYGPDQMLVQTKGNAYLRQSFPKLDWIKTAKIAP